MICMDKPIPDKVLFDHLVKEVIRLTKEDERIESEMDARLLTQDDKIAEVCEYIKDNLSDTLTSLIHTMEFTGELDTLIQTAINFVLTTALYADVTEVDPCEEMRVFNNVKVRTVRDDDMGISYIVTKISNRLKPRVKFSNGTDENAYEFNKNVIDYVEGVDNLVTINAGLRGVTVMDGVSHIENNTEANEGFYILCIDDEGNMTAIERNTSATEIINMGYRDAINIWSPILINGVPFNELVLNPQHEDYDYIFNQKHPRQVLGVLEDGSYVIITIDGRMNGEYGANFEQLKVIAQREGCVDAYNLDGGASTQTVIGKKLINRLISKSRVVGTVITFEEG